MTKPLPKPTRTVTVASKMDHDVVLHVDEPQDVRITGQHGATTERVLVPIHPFVTIWGKQRPRGEIPEGYHMPETRNGYALTRGVDADWWERWLEQHRNTPMVENKLVMAFPSEDFKELADYKDVRSGLEPIDTKSDPRLPKPINNAIGRIEIADRSAS